jgi:hypothetical protein
MFISQFEKQYWSSDKKCTYNKAKIINIEVEKLQNSSLEYYVTRIVCYHDSGNSIIERKIKLSMA